MPSKKVSQPMGPPDSFGKLEAMPSQQEDGWIYTTSGLIRVSYNDNFEQIQNNGIFEGMPVRYQLIKNMATNVRLHTDVDSKMVKKECMKKKKTLVDAAYYVRSRSKREHLLRAVHVLPNLLWEHQGWSKLGMLSFRSVRW